MVSVLDTPFEMSLRVLLQLSSARKDAMTADMLTIADTFTIYGDKFGISDDNLHGGDAHAFEEYDARRELVKDAVQILVLRSLIDVSKSEDGFRYAINEAGVVYTDSLVSEYADMYREAAKAGLNFINGKTERELFALILKPNTLFNGGRLNDG